MPSGLHYPLMMIDDEKNEGLSTELSNQTNSLKDPIVIKPKEVQT